MEVLFVSFFLFFQWGQDCFPGICKISGRKSEGKGELVAASSCVSSRGANKSTTLNCDNKKVECKLLDSDG